MEAFYKTSTTNPFSSEGIKELQSSHWGHDVQFVGIFTTIVSFAYM